MFKTFINLGIVWIQQILIYWKICPYSFKKNISSIYSNFSILPNLTLHSYFWNNFCFLYFMHHWYGLIENKRSNIHILENSVTWVSVVIKICKTARFPNSFFFNYSKDWFREGKWKVWMQKCPLAVKIPSQIQNQRFLIQK